MSDTTPNGVVELNLASETHARLRESFSATYPHHAPGSPQCVQRHGPRGFEYAHLLYAVLVNISFRFSFKKIKNIMFHIHISLWWPQRDMRN